jgi:hypothetical protein
MQRDQSLVNPGVKTDQHPARLATDIFNRMPISLWDVTDIASVQLLGSKSTVRSEQRYTQIAIDDVLLLIGVWMPM